MPNEERRKFFQYHPVYGYSGLPNVRDKFYGKYITHNSRGFRGPELDYEKPEGTERVVFIGDSQTWGWAVGDDETIPRLTGQLMNEIGKEAVYETVNLGATGYGVDQSYLRFITEGLRYDPDYVVFTYFADNDIWETSSAEAWGVEKPYIYEKEDGRLCVSNVPPARASGWPQDNLTFIMQEKFGIDDFKFRLGGLVVDLEQTHTARYFKNRSLNTALFRRWGSDDSDGLAAIKEHVGCLEREPGPALSDWNDKIDLALKLIYRIQRTAEEHGARFFVVTKPLERDYKSEQQEYTYKTIIKQLYEHRIDVIDLYPLAKVRGMDADATFQAAGHLTVRGNRLVAEALAERIAGIEQVQAGL
jgi:hypothetical protein